MKSESTYNATSSLVALLGPALFILWLVFVDTNIDGTPDEGVRGAIPIILSIGLLVYALLFLLFRLIGRKQYSYEKVSLKICFAISAVMAVPIPLFMFFGAVSSGNGFEPLTITEAVRLFLVWYIPLFASLVVGFVYQYLRIKVSRESNSAIRSNKRA